jgi:hypothetical protein
MSHSKKPLRVTPKGSDSSQDKSGIRDSSMPLRGCASTSLVQLFVRVAIKYRADWADWADLGRVGGGEDRRARGLPFTGAEPPTTPAAIKPRRQFAGFSGRSSPSSPSLPPSVPPPAPSHENPADRCPITCPLSRPRGRGRPATVTCLPPATCVHPATATLNPSPPHSRSLSAAASRRFARRFFSSHTRAPELTRGAALFEVGRSDRSTPALPGHARETRTQPRIDPSISPR